MVPSSAGPVGRNEAFSASVLPRPHALAEPGRRALLRDAAGPESGTREMRGGRWNIVWHALVGLLFVAHGIVTVAIWGPKYPAAAEG
jgi:hypothetical protein